MLKSMGIENSTPCKIVTQFVNLKLGTRDYVADITHRATLREWTDLGIHQRQKIYA